MKKFMFVSMMVFVFFMAACASESRGNNDKVEGTNGGNSVERPKVETSDDVVDIPCFTADDDNFFRCSGYNTNEPDAMDSMSVAAMENAQTLCVMKASRQVQGLMKTYYDRYAKSKKGNDLSNKMQQALDNVIRTKLNITKEICRKRSAYENQDGNITLYIGIEINKAKFADAYAKEVSDNLTPEEKTAIDFREDKFRQEAKGAFVDFNKNVEQDKKDYEKINSGTHE